MTDEPNINEMLLLAHKLKELGCAVAFFTPRQLEHVDPFFVESIMLDAGMRILERELAKEFERDYPDHINPSMILDELDKEQDE